MVLLNTRAGVNKGEVKKPSPPNVPGSPSESSGFAPETCGNDGASELQLATRTYFMKTLESRLSFSSTLIVI